MLVIVGVGVTAFLLNSRQAATPTTPPTEQTTPGLTVGLSKLTPNPSEGKMIMVDYDDPDHTAADLPVKLGRHGIDRVFSLSS